VPEKEGIVDDHEAASDGLSGHHTLCYAFMQELSDVKIDIGTGIQQTWPVEAAATQAKSVCRT
jgi:hypothetical protein